VGYTATTMSVQEPIAVELEREVEVRHAAGASPRDIARALGLRPAVVIPIVRRAAARRAADTRTAAGIYQLKVTLEDVSPAIWRRFQVPGRISLAGLHLVLQIVMGWENDHLYQFQVGRRVIDESGGGSSPVERPFGGRSKEDAGAVELRSVAPKKGARLTYVYDFGDNWCHEVLVEQTTCPDGDPDRAVCLGGKRACPPEDCGGVWGYEEVLAAIADPKNPALAERRAWLGPNYHPDRFDPAAVTARLRKFNPVRTDR
jgi:hypothetical protein